MSEAPENLLTKPNPEPHSCSVKSISKHPSNSDAQLGSEPPDLTSRVMSQFKVLGSKGRAQESREGTHQAKGQASIPSALKPQPGSCSPSSHPYFLSLPCLLSKKKKKLNWFISSGFQKEFKSK